MSDDILEIQPAPSPQRVARRALILSAVVCRSNSDRDPSNPDAIDLWVRLKKWIEFLDVGSELEMPEREMIFAPLGSLEEKKRNWATWRTEGLGVVAWALRRFPFAKLDSKVDPYELTDSLDLLSESAADLIQFAELRPRVELSACRELLYAIHCRLREFLRLRNARSISTWIESGWLDVLGVESPLGETGDICVGGKELHAADLDLVKQCEFAVHERHRAIIWLTGEEGPLYSDFPVDT